MERHGPIPSNKQVLASTAWSYFGEGGGRGISSCNGMIKVLLSDLCFYGY
jgi:hypothetical protein